MPRSRYSHAAAAVGGKIYVTGGATQVDSVNLVCVYDPQDDAWTVLADMSVARHGHALAAVGDKLYVFGGLNDGDKLSTVEVYDPASESWTQGSSLNPARNHLVTVAL